MSKYIDLVIANQQDLLSECVIRALKKVEGFSVTRLDLNKSNLHTLAKTPSCIVLLRPATSEQSAGLVTAILESYPKVKVLVLGTAPSDPFIVNYLEAGAKGYISEESSLAEVTAAIYQVAAGDIVCASKTIPRIFGRLADLCNKDRQLQQFKSQILTFRECEILELIAGGLTNEQIGVRLSISVHTVKNHVHNILAKMHVGRRLQAVQEAYVKRWLRLGAQGY